MHKSCAICGHSGGEAPSGRLAQLVQADALCKECISFMSTQLCS